MTEIPETLNHDSQMETLLNQMSEQIRQLEQENNEMRVQNLQYQHQIEARANEQTPSSSRFCTDIRSIPLLETPIKTITNDKKNGARRTPINNRADQNQEEQVTLLVNIARTFGGIIQSNAISISLPSNTHKAKLQRQLNEMVDLIRRILGMPVPIKKSYLNLYVDSPFTNNIALMEMPRKFSFPSMTLYDGTIDLDDYIA